MHTIPGYNLSKLLVRLLLVKSEKGMRTACLSLEANEDVTRRKHARRFSTRQKRPSPSMGLMEHELMLLREPQVTTSACSFSTLAINLASMLKCSNGLTEKSLNFRSESSPLCLRMKPLPRTFIRSSHSSK